MTRVFGCVLAMAAWVVVLAGCATVRCPAEGGKPWREITTAHFQVLTDLDSDDAREAAVRFERVRHLVLDSIPLDPPGRLPVVVSNADFGFGKRYQRRAVFTTGGGALLLVPFHGFGVNARIDRSESFAHEYTHYVVHALVTCPPKWLDEGMAQYFGALRFDEDGRSATLGHMDVDALRSLKSEHGLQSFQTLWRWGVEDPTGMAEYRRYSSSWFWVSYLKRKEGPRLAEFLGKLGSGTSGPVAWDEVFPESETREIESQVAADYKRWSIEWSLQTVPIPAEVGAGLVERELPPAEFHALLARLEETGLSGRSREEIAANREREARAGAPTRPLGAGAVPRAAGSCAGARAARQGALARDGQAHELACPAGAGRQPGGERGPCRGDPGGAGRGGEAHAREPALQLRAGRRVPAQPGERDPARRVRQRRVPERGVHVESGPQADADPPRAPAWRERDRSLRPLPGPDHRGQRESLRGGRGRVRGRRRRADSRRTGLHRQRGGELVLPAAARRRLDLRGALPPPIGRVAHPPLDNRLAHNVGQAYPVGHL
ncbi:MAG: DUF1570 domain-containing protein [Myxococcales bacterium]